MKDLMRQVRIEAIVFVPLILFALRASQAQDPAVTRKIVERSAPVYPALARNMALQGAVKVEALVAADGSVKSVEIKGGHPVLTQAAVNAVRHWRWEPTSHESHELVEIKFSPPE